MNFFSVRGLVGARRLHKSVAEADKNRAPELSQELDVLSAGLLMALTALPLRGKAGTGAVPFIS